MLVVMTIIMTVVMLGSTIALYEALRASRPMGWFIRIMDKSPIFQILFNVSISALIMIITGEGMSAGGANMLASLLFPFYCWVRNKINPLYRMVRGGWRQK